MKITFKYGCLAEFLLFALGAVAQGRPPATDVPAFTAQGAFVAIVVTDLDASVHWYESNLGLHLVKRGKSSRVPAESVVLGGHNLFVELIHHEGKALPRVPTVTARKWFPGIERTLSQRRSSCLWFQIVGVRDDFRSPMILPQPRGLVTGDTRCEQALPPALELKVLRSWC